MGKDIDGGICRLVFRGISLCLWWLPSLLFSQTAREVAVEIKASWVTGVGIKLDWRYDASTTSYDVYKRSGNTWVKKKNTSGLSWTDSFAVQGTRYEYRVARNSTAYTFTGNGYISSGFNIPATDNLGKVLLVVDSNYSIPLATEIGSYKQQLQNEGWTVISKSFLRTTSVADIKSWIKSQWDADSVNTKSVILLGRVPVPYSGNFRPDGHTDHTGAWPADMYYGTFWSSWTDVSVNNTSATRTENNNIPGDGKFDRSYINPNGTAAADIRYVQLPVGRIDLYNMPHFGRDTALVKQYLLKNIKFRTRNFKARNQFLIDDNFGFFAPGGEAFASGGFRNFATMNYDSIIEADYVIRMKSSSFLFSYGCGSGTYDAASGIGDYTIFKTDSLLNPFTMLFGSYFGDWDNENAFLRAPLAGRGWGLASAWSGRPYWMFHHCALGEPLYKAVLSSYNSYNIYNVGLHSSGVHTSLQGDPTLQLYPIAPIAGLSVDSSYKRKVKLVWTAYSDAADSILIEQNVNGSWVRFAALIGTATSIQFETNRGWLQFSVRPKKLITTSSGSFWQVGARATIYATSLPYVKYYCKSGSTSNLSSLSSWSSTANGSGSAPSDFGSDKEFILYNTSGSTSFTWNNSSDIQGKLTVPAAASLQLSSGITLKITGELENEGSISGLSTSTLEINSSLVQRWTGTTELYNIVIQCSAGVELAGLLGVQGSMNVSVGQVKTNGKLVFRSSSTGTGILLALGSGASISGTVSTEKFIPAKRAFRLLSPAVTSPNAIYYHWQEGGSSRAGYGTHITGSTSGANGFDASGSGNPSLFSFSNATGSWSAVPNTNTQILVAGTPYRLLVRGDRTINLNESSPTPTATILRDSGTLKTGNVVVNDLSSVSDGFSFVGNPYQSPVDMSVVLASASNLKTTYYHVWDPNIGVRGAYVAVNVLTNSNSLGSAANKLLQPGQACFVQTSANGSAALTFTESAKSSGISNVWKMELPFDAITLSLFRGGDANNRGILQDAVQVLVDSAPWVEKHPWDAGKLMNQDENLSISMHGSMFSTTVIGSGVDTIPLLLRQIREPKNRLEMQVGSLRWMDHVVLWDSYLDRQIRADSVGRYLYSWIAEGEKIDSNRFRLLIGNLQSMGTHNAKENSKQPFIAPNPARPGSMINIDLPLTPNAQASWYSLDGKLIWETVLQENKRELSVPASLLPGLYELRLKQGITESRHRVMIQ